MSTPVVNSPRRSTGEVAKCHKSAGTGCIDSSPSTGNPPMITVLVSGTIAKTETRTSKTGNAYTLASVRVQTADGDPLYAGVTAFSDLAPPWQACKKAIP